MSKKSGHKVQKKKLSHITERKVAQKEHLAILSNRMDKYSKLGYFERYAMYMGVAQLFEIGLKNLLVNSHGYEEAKLERKSLGHIVDELEKKKICPGLIPFLRDVVDERNYIAHHLLASDFLFHEMLKKPIGTYSKEQRRLMRATYNLEQAVYIFENNM